MSLADRVDFSLYTSPVCLAITYYFVEKKSFNQVARQKIEVLIKHLKITTVDQATIEKTLADPKIIDFEDGLEYYSSLNSDCQIIITENIKDFYFSKITVINCRTFIESNLIKN